MSSLFYSREKILCVVFLSLLSLLSLNEHRVLVVAPVLWSNHRSRRSNRRRRRRNRRRRNSTKRKRRRSNWRCRRDVRGLRPPDATGSRHTTQPAHAGVGGHHTTVSPLFFIAYPQTRVPAPSVLGPCAVAAGAGPQPMLSIALKLAS